MSAEIFLDSSAIYALTDKDDEAGPSVESFLKERRTPPVMTNLIFAESMSLITKRLGKRAGERTGEILLSSQFVRLVYLDEKIHRDAWTFYKKYRDKDFDFIDATSFVFCQKRGIKEALTLDRHFSQMGFKIYP